LSGSQFLVSQILPRFQEIGKFIDFFQKNVNRLFCIASLIVKTLEESCEACPVFIYGSDSQVIICLGYDQAQQKLNYYKDLNKEYSVWQILSDNPCDYICGYIPFEAHLLYPTRNLNSFEELNKLFIPATVIEVSSSQCKVIKDELNVNHFLSFDFDPERFEVTNLISINKYDHDLFDIFRSLFEEAHCWVKLDKNRRITIARKLWLSINIDLLETFAMASPSGIERAFYYRDDIIEFTGVSPELLAIGNTSKFYCHKLSGTGQRDLDPTIDMYLRNRIKICPKLSAEHTSSRNQIYQNLIKLGLVNTTPVRVLDLPYLRHLLTSFCVQPLYSASIADCLQAVMPSGAFPTLDGLAKIRELEKEPRGPYYGLVGVVDPEGKFSFSQVLRTVFRDFTSGTYAYAGAATIEDSKPIEEFLETRLKLSSIFVALKCF
jgi:isochorismate synthase EntC